MISVISWDVGFSVCGTMREIKNSKITSMLYSCDLTDSGEEDWTMHDGNSWPDHPA
ncbi:hypothetical protein Bca4012_027944 [Brassica carinata]